MSRFDKFTEFRHLFHLEPKMVSRLTQMISNPRNSEYLQKFLNPTNNVDGSSIDRWNNAVKKLENLLIPVTSHLRLPHMPDAGVQQLWFRGQGNSSHFLVPSALRPVKQRYLDEKNAILELRQRQPNLKKHSMFELLSIAQHHGLPTRVMDWSTNILVSLWFTCSKPEEDHVDGELFLLNPYKLNAYTCQFHGILPPLHPEVLTRMRLVIANDFKEFRSDILPLISDSSAAIGNFDLEAHLAPKLRAGSSHACQGHVSSIHEGYDAQSGWDIVRRLSMPVASFAPHLTARIAAQQGTFTVHGGKVYSKSHAKYPELERLPQPIGLTDLQQLVRKMRSQPDTRDETTFICSIVIPARHKANIRATMEEFGFHKGSMFPELDQQLEFITNRHTQDNSTSAQRKSHKEANRMLLEERKEIQINVNTDKEVSDYYRLYKAVLELDSKSLKELKSLSQSRLNKLQEKILLCPAYTPLIAASMFCNAAFFLNKAPSSLHFINKSDAQGRSALYIAVLTAGINSCSRVRATSGSVDCDQKTLNEISTLLKFGANPNLPDFRYKTPLDIAVMYGLHDLVTILSKSYNTLDYGQEHRSRPLLQFAIVYCQPRVVLNLLSMNQETKTGFLHLDVDALSQHGRTATDLLFCYAKSSCKELQEFARLVWSHLAPRHPIVILRHGFANPRLRSFLANIDKQIKGIDEEVKAEVKAVDSTKSISDVVKVEFEREQINLIRAISMETRALVEALGLERTESGSAYLPIYLSTLIVQEMCANILWPWIDGFEEPLKKNPMDSLERPQDLFPDNYFEIDFSLPFKLAICAQPKAWSKERSNQDEVYKGPDLYTLLVRLRGQISEEIDPNKKWNLLNVDLKSILSDLNLMGNNLQDPENQIKKEEIKQEIEQIISANVAALSSDPILGIIQTVMKARLERSVPITSNAEKKQNLLVQIKDHELDECTVILVDQEKCTRWLKSNKDNLSDLKSLVKENTSNLKCTVELLAVQEPGPEQRLEQLHRYLFFKHVDLALESHIRALGILETLDDGDRSIVDYSVRLDSKILTYSIGALHGQTLREQIRLLKSEIRIPTSPLYEAVFFGATVSVNALLDSKVDISVPKIRARDDFTPLMLAVWAFNKKMVDLLLNHVKNANSLSPVNHVLWTGTASRKSALHVAIDTYSIPQRSKCSDDSNDSQTDSLKEFNKKMKAHCDEIFEVLWKCVETGENTNLKKFIFSHIYDFKCSQGYSYLHHCARVDAKNPAKALLRYIASESRTQSKNNKWNDTCIKWILKEQKFDHVACSEPIFYNSIHLAAHLQCPNVLGIILAHLAIHCGIQAGLKPLNNNSESERLNAFFLSPNYKAAIARPCAWHFDRKLQPNMEVSSNLSLTAEELAKQGTQLQTFDQALTYAKQFIYEEYEAINNTNEENRKFL